MTNDTKRCTHIYKHLGRCLNNAMPSYDTCEECTARCVEVVTVGDLSPLFQVIPKRVGKIMSSPLKSRDFHIGTMVRFREQTHNDSWRVVGVEMFDTVRVDLLGSNTNFGTDKMVHASDGAPLGEFVPCDPQKVCDDFLATLGDDPARSYKLGIRLGVRLANKIILGEVN